MSSDHDVTAAPVRAPYLNTKRILQAVALALVLIPAIVLPFAPIYDEARSASTGAVSLIAANGPTLILFLAIPVIAAILPLVSHGRTWTVMSLVAAGILVVWVIGGMFTIGIFFFPAAIVEIIAASRSRQAKLKTHSKQRQSNLTED